MRKRIGYQMVLATRYVAENPGCRQYEAAQAVGPNGSNNYGTRTVRRAQAAGLIRYDEDRGGYKLYVTDEGRELL